MATLAIERKAWVMPQGTTPDTIAEALDERAARVLGDRLEEPQGGQRDERTESDVPDGLAVASRGDPDPDAQLDLFAAPEVSSELRASQIRDDFRVRFADSPTGSVRDGLERVASASDAVRIAETTLACERDHAPRHQIALIDATPASAELGWRGSRPVSMSSADAGRTCRIVARSPPRAPRRVRP